MTVAVEMEPRTKALKNFLKRQHSLQNEMQISRSGGVFDVDGMMFYVLKKHEVTETMQKFVSGFVKNPNSIELDPKKLLARFDHQEHKVDNYFIYRMM